jgi:hypothetical protein
MANLNLCPNDLFYTKSCNVGFKSIFEIQTFKILLRINSNHMNIIILEQIQHFNIEYY